MRKLQFFTKNIFREIGPSLLLTLGLMFAVGALFILLALRTGVSHLLVDEPGHNDKLNQVTVYQSARSFLQLTTPSARLLTPDVLANFKNTAHVVSVTPQLLYSNLATLQGSVLGIEFQTDTLIFGVPHVLVTESVPAAVTWDSSTLERREVPVIISRTLIDFFNLGLAPSIGLPSLSEKLLIGQKIKILPGVSSFLTSEEFSQGQTLEGTIVGFSNEVDLFGISLPIDAVQELNKISGRESALAYSKVIITTDSPSSADNVARELKNKGYQVRTALQEFSIGGKILRSIDAILFTVSAVIVILAIFVIFTSVWVAAMRRRREIGIYRSIGASQSNIRSMLFLQTAFFGLLGSALGVAAGFGGVEILQKIFEAQTPFFFLRIEDVLAPTPLHAGILILCGLVISLIACIVPIKLLLRQPPYLLISK